MKLKQLHEKIKFAHSGFDHIRKELAKDLTKGERNQLDDLDRKITNVTDEEDKERLETMAHALHLKLMNKYRSKAHSRDDLRNKKEDKRFKKEMRGE